MTIVIFHDFPGMENSFLKFHHFSGYVETMYTLWRAVNHRWLDSAYPGCKPQQHSVNYRWLYSAYQGCKSQQHSAKIKESAENKSCRPQTSDLLKNVQDLLVYWKLHTLKTYPVLDRHADSYKVFLTNARRTEETESYVTVEIVCKQHKVNSDVLCWQFYQCHHISRYYNFCKTYLSHLGRQ